RCAGTTQLRDQFSSRVVDDPAGRLRRGRVRDELGLFGLEVFEPADELVVLGIGDEQGVLVVRGPVLLDPLRQLGMGPGTLGRIRQIDRGQVEGRPVDRKSTRLNSSHVSISYAVFRLKKKTNTPKEQ